MDTNIKKNILDLQFQKFMNIASTIIIIIFTYFIGVGIGFMTKQIKINDIPYFFMFLIFSAIILTPCLILFAKSYYKIKEIPKEIQNIK